MTTTGFRTAHPWFSCSGCWWRGSTSGAAREQGQEAGVGATATYPGGVFGREKQHPWLGKPEHERIVTIAVYIFGGLMLLLILSAFVAAVIG